MSEKEVPVKDKPECTAPVIGIGQGKLCGKREILTGGKSVYTYLGIPYAESTGGENRWRPPVPHKGWKGVFKATYPGSSCPQIYGFKFINPASEDCLSINVWTPEVNTKTARAVMVFIYGGYFLHGFSGDPLYDGSYISAKGGVVVVSMNYRLGALGFLAGLTDRKTGEEISGNFGLLDQIQALEWVHDNISAFGGDPDKVTVYGESAGAMSVGIHLTGSPRSEGLFRAAIMESNPFGIPFKSVGDARPAAERFAERLGCPRDDVACMRGKSFFDVLTAQVPGNVIWETALHGLSGFIDWSPVIDGKIFTVQPVEAIQKRPITKPILLGTNKSEALLFVEFAKKKMNVAGLTGLDYRLIVDLIFRDHELTDEIYKTHPPAEGDNTDAASKLLTEYLFLCPNFLMAENAPPDKTWVYLFDHVPSFNIWESRGILACGEAVCHGAELAFVFGSAEKVGQNFTEEETVLSDAMILYWANFAKNLDPNGSGPEWPQYQSMGSNVILVTPVDKIGRVSDMDDHCLFWNKVGYDLHYSLWDIL